MKRSRKLLAFLTILVILTGLVYMTFSDQVSEILKLDAENTVVARIACGNDGNIYELLVKNNRYILRCCEPGGDIIYERRVPEISDIKRHYLHQLFVSSDGSVYIAAYEYDKSLVSVSGLHLYCFENRLKKAIDLNYTALEEGADKFLQMNRFRYMSFSEHEDGVYVPLYADGELRVLHHSNTDRRLLIEESRVDVTDEVTTAIVMMDTTLVVGYEQGAASLYDRYGTETQLPGNDAYYSQFMQNARNRIVFVDAKSDMLRSLDIKTGWTNVLYDEGDSFYNLSFGDVSKVSYNYENKLALLSGDGSRLIVVDHEDMFYFYPLRTRFLDDQLLVLVVITAALLLASFIIYDLYFNYLRGRVSLAAKQVFTSLVIIWTAFDILVVMVLAPNYSDQLDQNMNNRLITVASMVASDVDPSKENYNIDIRKTSKLLSEETSAVEQIEFLLAETDENFDDYRIRASSRYYEPGFRLDSPSYESASYWPGKLKGMNGSGGVPVQIWDDKTIQKAVAVQSVPNNPNWLVFVKVTKNKMYSNLETMFTRIELIFVITGACLMLMLFAAQMRIVTGLRRLIKGVDLVSAGNLDVHIEQHSGDELESLASSFNAMTGIIRSMINRLDTVNASYYRFVPQSLVRLLDKSSAVDLNKKSHLRRDMTVMMIWFRFEDQSDIADTDVMFDNINEVLERIAPVAYSNGGTIYDFRNDGFNVVFESRSQNVLSTAVAVRQEILTLNQERAQRGSGEVDLRIAIDSGSVMMGIIGDDNRMSPSAISDVLLVTQQLIRLCSKLDSTILCTRAALPQSEKYTTRLLGRFDRDGEQSELFEVTDGDVYSLKNAKLSYQEEFDRGITLFYSGDFVGAKHVFMKIVKNESRDGAARNYLYLAYLYEKEPPEILTLNI